MNDFNYTVEILLMILAVMVAKKRTSPFFLMITSLVIIIMSSYHDMKLNAIAEMKNTDWLYYNLTFLRYFFTQSIVIFFMAISLCFVKDRVVKYGAVVLFLNSSFCAFFGIMFDSTSVIALKPYIQYFFVIIILVIAWMSSIKSRVDYL